MNKKLFFLINGFFFLLGLAFVSPKKVFAYGPTCGSRWCSSDSQCLSGQTCVNTWCRCNNNDDCCTATGTELNAPCSPCHKECVGSYGNGLCKDVFWGGSDKCSGNCDCKCCDTDGGKVYTVRGTACAINSAYPNGKNCGTDVCVTDGFTLMEYYCGTGGYPLLTSYNCKNSNEVCQNGRCVKLAGPTATPRPTSPPAATPTPAPNCNDLCKQSGYSSGTCRSLWSGCNSGETNIGQDNCSWSQRCCCKVAPTPIPPTPTPIPNQAPTCLSLSANPISGNKPLTVNFTGSGRDNDGSINQYQWDFDGNGTWDQTTSSNTTSYTYTNQGNSTARLRVRDNDGAWSSTPASCQKTISITACIPPEGPALTTVTQTCQTSGTYTKDFSWTAPVGTQPIDYRFEISENADYSSATKIETGTDTSTNIAQRAGVSLDTDRTYYWRVRAQNACGCFYGTQYGVSSGYSNSCSVLGEALERWLTPTPTLTPTPWWKFW